MQIVDNYTTKIAASKTAAQMQELLAAHGVSRIMIDYRDGRARGLTFEIDTEYGPRMFSLPVDVDAMHRLLVAEKKAGRLGGISKPMAEDPAHAERVAWRVVGDWLRSQLTLVASRMATIDQVMLPYLVVDGRTLYNAYREQQQAALESSR